MEHRITGTLVGQKFCTAAKVALSMIYADVPVMLAREADNPHDANAVRVLLPLSNLSDLARARVEAEFRAKGKDQLDPMPLGFIDRASAAQAAPIMDGKDPDSAVLAFADDRELVNISWANL